MQTPQWYNKQPATVKGSVEIINQQQDVSADAVYKAFAFTCVTSFDDLLWQNSLDELIDHQSSAPLNSL